MLTAVRLVCKTNDAIINFIRYNKIANGFVKVINLQDTFSLANLISWVIYSMS